MLKKDFEQRIKELKTGEHVKIVWRGNYGINEDFGYIFKINDGRIALNNGFNVASQRIYRIEKLEG